MSNRAMSPAMIRELRSIAATGEPTDPAEWHGANALWFHARDRVIGALLRRLLIADLPGGFQLTDAGRAFLEMKAQQEADAESAKQ